MTDIQCLAKLEAVLAENEALIVRAHLLEKVNEGFTVIKDPYENFKKENEKLKEQLEYLTKELFGLWGVPVSVLENGFTKTATQIADYENKKFVEHLKKNLDAAINSCYADPKIWDDFVGNYNSINDSKYLI